MNRVQKDSKRKQKRIGLQLIALMAIAICAVVFFGKIKLDKEHNEQLRRQDSLTKQIDEAGEKTAELEKFMLYMKTKKYVEDVAREIFGLVYPDEIVIQPEE